MQLREIESAASALLEAERFRDYCPNGLQVEGRPEVRRLVSGVSASLDFLRAAVADGADAVLTHHGYFWRNEDARLIGVKRARIGLLVEAGVSLLAYHLPLDAHRELGNNAQLARLLGFEIEGWFADQEIAARGRLPAPASLGELGARIAAVLQRPPLLVGDPARPVRRIAWCTGAAQDLIEEAAALGVDAFLSGEISERTVHLARELGVAYIAAGHHATERYGVQALGEHLARRFGIEHRYIEIDNPA